jgi:hypothetical protein
MKYWVGFNIIHWISYTLVGSNFFQIDEYEEKLDSDLVSSNIANGMSRKSELTITHHTQT